MDLVFPSPLLPGRPVAAPEPAALRVVLFEAERLGRETLSAFLDGAVAGEEGRFRVVGAFGGVGPALEAAAALRPGLLVVEPRLPAKAAGGGPELVSRFARVVAPFGTRLLVCSAVETGGSVLGCLRAGAHGYVAKASGPEVLRRAMAAIAAGENFYDAGAQRLLTAVAAQGINGAACLHGFKQGPRAPASTDRARARRLALGRLGPEHQRGRRGPRPRIQDGGRLPHQPHGQAGGASPGRADPARRCRRAGVPMVRAPSLNREPKRGRNLREAGTGGRSGGQGRAARDYPLDVPGRENSPPGNP